MVHRRVTHIGLEPRSGLPTAPGQSDAGIEREAPAPLAEPDGRLLAAGLRQLPGTPVAIVMAGVQRRAAARRARHDLRLVGAALAAVDRAAKRGGGESEVRRPVAPRRPGSAGGAGDRLAGLGGRLPCLEFTANRTAVRIRRHCGQLAVASLPRSAATGPSAFGVMSNSKASIGTASVQQALGMSTIALIRPSHGAQLRMM